MKTQATRTKTAKAVWPRKIHLGRVTVTVYKRTAPSGDSCFMVANYSTGQRRFDSYGDEAAALDAANRLARQLSEREVVAAAMTNAQAADYAAAVEAIAPLGISLPTAANLFAAAVRLVGDGQNVLEAAKQFARTHATVVRKPVAEAVAEFIAARTQRTKKGRPASARYVSDMNSRLGRFAAVFCKDVCDVDSTEIQSWLDSMKTAGQTYKNYRAILHSFFGFAVSRNLAAVNPVAKVTDVSATDAEIEVWTPEEMERLIAAAAPRFLPVLALAAFSGMRSAEICRLEWKDISFDDKEIDLTKTKAKTHSARTIPMHDNLAAFLAPYAGQTGKVWKLSDSALYNKEMPNTATAAGLTWKANALRHSYATYRYGETSNIALVAAECGNSVNVLLKHYKKPNKKAAEVAARWFAIRPAATPANIVAMPTAAAA